MARICTRLRSRAPSCPPSGGPHWISPSSPPPAQIGTLLLESDFAARFLNKGVLGEVLARVPVWLVDHGQLGLVGAAAWYFERQAEY